MSRCPKCGGSLWLACEVEAVYVVDSLRGRQEWIRAVVDDSTAQPIYACCRNCEVGWIQVGLNEDGEVVSVRSEWPLSEARPADPSGTLARILAEMCGLPDAFIAALAKHCLNRIGLASDEVMGALDGLTDQEPRLE